MKEMKELNELNVVIREGRKKLGLSQANLGKKIGVSRITVGAWERGIAGPSGKNLIRINRIISK